MLADVRLLLWLRVRHARSKANQLMHLVGAGIETGTWGEQAYQLYTLTIVAVALVLMWAALLDAVETLAVVAGAQVCMQVTCAALLLLPVVLLVVGVRGLITSPLKFTHPDIAYVAASPVSAWALVAVAAGVQALGAALAAALGGYLLGVALVSVGVLGAESIAAAIFGPLAVAATFGLLMALAVVVGWVPGVARLTTRRRGRAAGGAWRIDMTRVIRESAFFADVATFDAFSPLSQEVVRDYRRRRKLALRPVRFRLPAATGRAALVARAALSHVRQYDGIPHLAMQALGVAPLGVCAMLGAGGPALFLFWLQALLMANYGAREMTRAFRDDVRNRLVRDRLPYSVLELLVLDSLPAFALVTVLSCVSVGLMLPAFSQMAIVAGDVGNMENVSAVVALVLSVLVNVCAVLSCGLDAMRLHARGPRLCYEYGVLALVAVQFALFLFGGPIWGNVVALAFLCAVLASLIHSGLECAN